MPEIGWNALIFGSLAILTGLLGSSGRLRGRWAALPFLAALAIAGYRRVLLPADLPVLPALAGHGLDSLALVGWLAYSALGVRLALPGPTWLVAFLSGGLQGGLGAATVLREEAVDRPAAARLILAAGAGALLGRVGNPALLLLGDRDPRLAILLLPLSLALLLAAGVRAGDRRGAPGSRAATGIALATTALALAPGVGIFAPWLGAFGLALLRWTRRGAPPEAALSPAVAASTFGWGLGALGVALVATIAGFPGLAAAGMINLFDAWDQGLLPRLAVGGGVVGLLFGAPGGALLSAALVDRSLEIDVLPAAVALGAGLGVGSVAELLAARCLRPALPRLLWKAAIFAAWAIWALPRIAA